ncbi:hypothetical protein JCM8202_003510 [Rhodotorula sphaerocarpa]
MQELSQHHTPALGSLGRLDAGSSASSSLKDPAGQSLRAGPHVSFHPFALRITTAPEGEAEQAMVASAREELAHRKRKVGVRTYSWDTPQIGDATAKAWHSVLNGFTASLEPFLNSPSAGGGVCSSRRSYVRESSPDRCGSFGRTRARSASSSSSRPRGGSTGSADDGLDPKNPEAAAVVLADTPTSVPPRLRLKLPTIKRSSTRSIETGTSPTSSACCPRSILRSRSLSPSTSPPPAAPLRTAATEQGHFPTLARVRSPPPPPYHEPTSPAASDVVPLLPCCPDCEPAAVYGSETTRSGDYEEKWSRGAQRIREEAEKREARRAACKQSAALAEKEDRYRCPIELLHGRSAAGDGDPQSPTEEEPASRLGELVKRHGHVDELGGPRETDGAADEPEEGLVEADSGPVEASRAADDLVPEQPGPAEERIARRESRDAPATPGATQSPLPPRSEPQPKLDPSTPTTSHPNARRRLSSFSSKIPTFLGGGLMSPPLKASARHGV